MGLWASTRYGPHAPKHWPKCLVSKCECAGDVMLCCQQAEAKSVLDCKQHSGFCFYVLYSSNGTRLCLGGCTEILCKPIFRSCGGNLEWNPRCPCASIKEMWSRPNFIFSGTLCLLSFLSISGVCWISTLSEVLPSMLTQQRSFSKFSRLFPVWWLYHVPAHMRTRFYKNAWNFFKI